MQGQTPDLCGSLCTRTDSLYAFIWARCLARAAAVGLSSHRCVQKFSEKHDMFSSGGLLPAKLLKKRRLAKQHPGTSVWHSGCWFLLFGLRFLLHMCKVLAEVDSRLEVLYSQRRTHQHKFWDIIILMSL